MWSPHHCQRSWGGSAPLRWVLVPLMDGEGKAWREIKSRGLRERGAFNSAVHAHTYTLALPPMAGTAQACCAFRGHRLHTSTLPAMCQAVAEWHRLQGPMFWPWHDKRETDLSVWQRSVCHGWTPPLRYTVPSSPNHQAITSVFFIIPFIHPPINLPYPVLFKETVSTYLIPFSPPCVV